MADVRQRRAVAGAQAQQQPSAAELLAGMKEADCQAAAPGIGKLNACHALKFIAVTFAVLSLAFSADLISVFPSAGLTAAGGAEPSAAAWKDMKGERLQVVRPVVVEEPMPEMDTAPRADPIQDYGLPKDVRVSLLILSLLIFY